jgi:hypothetical protein
MCLYIYIFDEHPVTVLDFKMRVLVCVLVCVLVYIYIHIFMCVCVRVHLCSCVCASMRCVCVQNPENGLEVFNYELDSLPTAWDFDAEELILVNFRSVSVCVRVHVCVSMYVCV